MPTKRKKADKFANWSPWQKLAAVGLGLLILRKAFAAPSVQDITEQETNDELARLMASGVIPNFSDLEFIQMANKLENAMFDVGTDEDSIYQVFNLLLNDADFLKLNQAFGYRTYTGGYIPGVIHGKENLAGWIAEELDQEEVSKVNKLLSGYSLLLGQPVIPDPRKNIKYRF
jgi:hypothetical protein